MNKRNFWKEYFSVPNLMGYGRIALAFLYLAFCFDASDARDYHCAALVMAVSMVTDFLDGKIARRFNMVTDWGKILDPVADKITLGVAAFSFVLRYPLAETLIVVFLVKEGFMAAAGLLLMRRGWRTEGALLCGKVCTASLYGGCVLLLLFPNLEPWQANALLLAELVIMLGTLASYMELYLCAWLELRRGADPAKISLKAIQQERKQKHVPVKRAAFAAALLCLLYVAAGAVIPYRAQPEVTRKTMDAFHVADYYAKDASEESEDDASAAASGGKNGRAVSGEPEKIPEAAEAREAAERARIIDRNKEALDTRIQMIGHARERVILSTFDFRSDDAGMDLLAALLNAAERGVKVEIFADGFNSWLRMEGNPYFYALSSHPNAEILLYNKMNLLKPWKMMGRMHDKYVIVDDTAYLLGGRNSFGYFLGDYEGHKNYDWDVLVYQAEEMADSSLHQLTEYYERITSMDCVSLFHDRDSLAQSLSVRRARAALERRYAVLQESLPELFAEAYDYAANTEPASRITLLSNPVEYPVKEPVVFYELMQLAQNATEEVVIHTPYIMCNDWMYGELAKLGGKATLMLNSAAGNGNPFAALDYMEHKKELIDTGVNILEYEGGISYHGKVMTMDRNLAVVGSFNLDMRSTYLDTELMLVIDSESVNRTLRSKMEQYEKSTALVQDAEHYAAIPEGMELREVSAARKLLKAAGGWLLERLRFLL